MKARLAPFALAFAYLLFLLAWSLGNPPGAAPDEAGHFVKALAAGKGDLVLEEKPEPLTGADANDRGRRFQWTQTRLVQLPAPMSPALIECGQNRSENSRVWRCPPPDPPPAPSAKFPTGIATYPPYMYLIPGVFMNLTTTAVAALLTGRVVSMIICFAFIAAAIFLVHEPERSRTSLLGLVAALTPMTIFVAANLTASGPEIAAGACLAAAILRLSRDAPARNSRPDGFAWIAGGAAALVLSTARDLGPVWVTLYALLWVALAGPPAVRRRLRAGGGPAVAAAAASLTGLALALYWQFAHQVRAPLASEGLGWLGAALSTTKEVARQEIGVFGILSVVLPPRVYVIWGAVLIGLGVLALALGTTRERIVLLAALLAGVLVPAGVDLLQRLGGFGVQGRHVLPFTVAIPMLAGEMINRHAGESRWLWRFRPAAVLSVAAAAVMAYCWYFNAKFFMAGRKGPNPFWLHVSDGPPTGWVPLAWAISIGMASMALSGILAASGGSEPATPSRPPARSTSIRPATSR